MIREARVYLFDRYLADTVDLHDLAHRHYVLEGVQGMLHLCARQQYLPKP